MDSAEQENAGGKKAAAGNYSAPALEKGLDILELLSLEPGGLSLLQIAKSLERTPTEIFRMVNALERRSYLARDSDGSYHLTLKLFELSHRHPPTKSLLSVALPVMRHLAMESRQSAHLAVYHQGRVLVVAQVDSPEPLNFGVKLGTHFPMMPERTSAKVLAAFAPEAARKTMLAEMIRNAPGADAVEVDNALTGISANGFYLNPSQTTAGVIDVSCPIFDHTGTVTAAITVPYLRQSNIKVTVEHVLTLVQAAAMSISLGIGMVPG